MPPPPLCTACHSTDGATLIGPTWKGLYLKEETGVTDGEEREILVDEDYIKNSILELNADVVKGFLPIMPPQKGDF